MKHKKRGFTIAGLIFILLFLAFFTLFRYNNSSKEKSEDHNTLASKTIEICSNQKYKSACYDKEIPKLMEPPSELSMEEAFEVARKVQKNDKSFVFCHVLGHKLAEKETSKDPSRWKEVISRCPSGVCSNGCIHGAFQEKFRNESLTDAEIESIKPELLTICRERENFHPSGIEQGSCYHALGHLTMYLTAADVRKSVQLCKELAISEKKRDFRAVCFDGVFMQIFQPLEPEDYALIKNLTSSIQNVQSFCNQFEGKEKASCWSESWPLKVEDLKKAEGLITFCSYLEEKNRTRCFDNMFYIMPIQFKFDTQTMLLYCASFPEELSGKCASQVALRYVQNDFENIDEAVDFCQKSLYYDTKQRCFEVLATQASYNFPKNSSQYQTMCSSLPPEWSEKCL
jgi:hypothetical protein